MKHPLDDSIQFECDFNLSLNPALLLPLLAIPILISHLSSSTLRYEFNELAEQPRRMGSS